MRRFLIVFTLMLVILLPNVSASLVTNVNSLYSEVNAGFEGVYSQINFTTNENIKNVKIFTDLPLQNSFSSNNFNINNSSYIVNFSIEIPTLLSPNTYNAKFYVIYEKDEEVIINQSANQTEIITMPYSFNTNYQVIINDTMDYNIKNSINFTLSNDDEFNFTLEVKNIGNYEFEIKIESDDNEILNLNKKYTIYPGETKELFYEGIIPLNLTPGQYDFNITYVTNSINKTTRMYFNVTDNILPECVINAPNEVEIYQPIQASIGSIKDNIKVYDYWMKVWDPDGDFTEYDHKLDNIKYNTKKFGTHEITLSINDTSGNLFVCRKKVNVTKSEILQLESDVLNLGKIKAGDNEKKFQVASLYDNVRINVTLENVSNNALDYYICTEVDCFDVLENEPFTIEKATYIYVKVYSNVIGKASGYLKFTAPDWINLPNKRVKFNIEFINYDVPDPIYMDIFGKFYRHCWANDTGDYDTSTYTCQEVYPIDVETGEMGTFVTQEMLDSYKSGQERELGIVTGTIGGQGILIWILLIVLVVGGILVYYELYIAPKIIMLRG
jgi:hypothetical protein